MLSSQSGRFVLIALANAALFWTLLPLVPAWPLLIAQSLLVALLALRVHDRYWWALWHLLWLPALVLAAMLALPAWSYLAALAALWLLCGHVVRTRVPWYLSSQRVPAVLAERLPQNARVLDAGAAQGGVLLALHQARPDLQLAGVELALLPWLLGRLRLPREIGWQRADYQELELRDYDCVYAFLSPAAMPALWEQAGAQMRPGSLFISNAFEVPDRAPDERIDYGDWKGGHLMIWRM